MSRYDIVMQYFNEQKEENERITNEGIEKYRKGDFSVILDGENELPENINVEIEQLDHEFRFGANLFMLNEFDDEWKNEIYKEKFINLFNLATLPFYWNATEPEKRHYRFDKDSEKLYRRPPIDLCMEFCEKHGIEPKLHCLNYDSHAPEWTWNLSNDELKSELENRFKMIGERYGERIPSIEVTNETLMAKHHTSFFMEDDFVEWSFKTADKYFKNNQLIINDFNLWDPSSHNRNYYYMQIERLLNNGITHLDTIGMQFHCFFSENDEVKHAYQKFNPQRLRELFDLFAKLNKNMQITEMTIPARSWDPENEMIQAELTTNLYKVLFSYPNMNAIIYWNLVDGYGYMPQGGEPGDMTKGENIYYGGFLRYDMTEKPVYKALDDLINREWHTSVNSKVNNGQFDFRGFYGKYRIKVSSSKGEKTFTTCFSKGSDNVFKIKI